MQINQIEWDAMRRDRKAFQVIADAWRESLDLQAAVDHLEWCRGLRIPVGMMAELIRAAETGEWGGDCEGGTMSDPLRLMRYCSEDEFLSGLDVVHPCEYLAELADEVCTCDIIDVEVRMRIKEDNDE